MRFRLVWYVTQEEDKYESSVRHEYLGDRQAIFELFFILHHKLGYRHVEVYNLKGGVCDLEMGMAGMVDYNL